MNVDVLKIILPTLMAWLIGLLITPSITSIMYRKKLWKSTSRQDDSNPDEISPTFKKVHNEEEELNTPRVGGVIIWGAVLITVVLLFVLSFFLNGEYKEVFDFVSRAQTLVPLAALILGALFGLFEDFIEIRMHNKNALSQGLPDKYLIMVVSGLALIFALWFYVNLDRQAITIPFGQPLNLGWLFVPFFMITMLATFSSRVIDGIDGLAGGVMAIIFAAFGVLGIIDTQFDLAALSFAISGGLLAFLWFNIPPARFYMGETGMLGLTLTLVVIAFSMERSLWLLIIAFPLVATAFSSAAQIAWKRHFNKKLFKVAPLHHHFQALGWSNAKIVMRYWVFGMMCASLGILIALIG